MATEEAYAGKVDELRHHFFDTLKENEEELYDSRDIQRIKEDDRLVQCYMRSFSIDLGVKEPAEQMHTILKWRKKFGISGTMVVSSINSLQQQEDYRTHQCQVPSWGMEVHLTEKDITDDNLPQELFERMYLYWHGVDKMGHKILLLKVVKHKKGKLREETKKHIAHTLERHHKENPGEKIVFVFDFSGASVSNVDMDVVKFIISALSNYFPSLLKEILLFEMPFILSAAWRVIKSWLSEEQKQMIILIKRDKIHEHISSDQLEEHMIQK